MEQMDLVVVGDEMAHREIKRLKCAFRNMVNPFTLRNEEFVKRFRLNKLLVVRLIDDLRPHIRHSLRKGSLSIETKVFTALNFYASGSYQRAVSDSWLHCVGRSTAGQCIREVTDALNQRTVQKKWIKFPRTKQERGEFIERNVQRFGIPDVLGYIDGTEVEITSPPKNMNAQTYWTRKHHYALNCQIVCDSHLYIMNMLANFPGSCNDAFIYKSSAVRKKMRKAYQEGPCWILGDSGYPNEPWCIIPLLDTEPGSPEEYFTKRHCKSRNCVERCIGVLKARFRCLLKDRALHYLPQRAGKIIKACCVLHNMCISGGLPEPQIVEGEEDGRPWVPQQHELEAEMLEDAAEIDPRLAIDPADANIGVVGDEVRNRLVQFLSIHRQENEAIAEENNDNNNNENVDYPSDEENERVYQLLLN